MDEDTRDYGSRLDDIEAKLDELIVAKRKIESIIEEAGPMLAAMKDNPMLQMLMGG